MSDYTTNFPPQTYSSSFYLNSLVDMKCIGKLICFLGLLLVSSAQSPAEKKYCILEESSKTVTFSSLSDFQNSRRSFNTHHPSYQGNFVNFNFKSIDTIVKNAFIAFDSNSVIKISLNDKGIKTINDGAFNGLFCLHYLDLTGNNISSLTEDVFQGLENLWELNLSENLFERVFDNGFILRNVPNLKVLNLSKNKIQNLNTLAFLNLTKLEVLDLGNNKIRTFSPKIFSSLQSLRDLYLNNNYLTDIEPYKWNGLDNLKFLNLAHNSLVRFDPNHNFSLMSLEKLDLSGNYLTILNVFELKRRLTKLVAMDISENAWLCDELDNVERQLSDSKIVLEAYVNCSTSGEYRQPTTETIVFSTPSTTIASAKIAEKIEDYSKRANDEVLFSNEKILDDLQRLQALVVFLCVVVVLFIVIYVSARVGLCQILYDRMTERSRAYLEDNDREHLVLMRS